MAENLLKKLADHGTFVAGIIAGVTAIVGSVIAFESRYAQAADLQDIVQVYRGSQQQTQLFQLDYYSDKIKRLEDERRRSVQVYEHAGNSPAKIITRTPAEVTEDLDDLKKRKAFLEKQMIESQRALTK